MPIYSYACSACTERTEVFVRRIGADAATICPRCGSGPLRRLPERFAMKRDVASELANLDPKYHKMIDAAIAKTPEADPMRLLAKLTPFGDAEAPGDPVNF